MPRSTTSSTASSRAPSRWPASPTAARPCAWPTRRWNRVPAAWSGSTKVRRLAKAESGEAMQWSTIRLTAAQAVVRYLAAQRTMLDGADVPLFAGCWAIFGHGNVAGLGEALYQARETLPTYPRPQRAGHGAGGGRLRQGQEPPADDGLHDLDRAGLHEHADRRRRRPCQPAAGPAAARRRVRQSPARPGAAADRGLQRRHHERQRLLPPGLALVGPDHPARSSC